MISQIKNAVAAALLLVVMTMLAPSYAQVSTPGIPMIPLGYCQITSLSAAVSITGATCTRASFTATGSGVNLTTSSVSGVIRPGDMLAGTGTLAGTYIASQTSGTTGGAGVYVTSKATTSSSATLTSGGVPLTATLLYVEAEAQAVRYRDDGVAPSSSVGVPIASGGALLLAAGLTALSFIEQTSGAKLNVSAYRSP